jgi:hypothetical protein
MNFVPSVAEKFSETDAGQAENQAPKNLLASGLSGLRY